MESLLNALPWIVGGLVLVAVQGENIQTGNRSIFPLARVDTVFLPD